MYYAFLLLYIYLVMRCRRQKRRPRPTRPGRGFVPLYSISLSRTNSRVALQGRTFSPSTLPNTFACSYLAQYVCVDRGGGEEAVQLTRAARARGARYGHGHGILGSSEPARARARARMAAREPTPVYVSIIPIYVLSNSGSPSLTRILLGFQVHLRIKFLNK